MKALKYRWRGGIMAQYSHLEKAVWKGLLAVNPHRFSIQPAFVSLKHGNCSPHFWIQHRWQLAVEKKERKKLTFHLNKQFSCFAYQTHVMPRATKETFNTFISKNLMGIVHRFIEFLRFSIMNDSDCEIQPQTLNIVTRRQPHRGNRRQSTERSPSVDNQCIVYQRASQVQSYFSVCVK